MKKFNKIVIDPFCNKQFVKGNAGYINFDLKEF